MSNHSDAIDTNRNREMISQKSIKILCTSIGVLLFCTATPPNSNASSLNDKDFQIQAIVLSNLGPGLSFSYQFSKNLWLNLEGQSLSGDMSEDSNDGLATEKSGFDSQTSYLNIRYYLASVDGLFFQTGLVNRNWEAKKEIYSKQNGERKAVYRVDYPEDGYNLGIGKNWTFNSGLTTSITFVRLITGEPSINYELGNDWECNSACQSDFESDVNKYSPENVLFLSVGYSF
jgi:hypothetical protein